ncbi:MAG TPA: MdtA/MuxA family multidrug efflux RND transporter periplasmic adaptor subunit [Usitatibacter sp.]|nr:MdtA/MuxA family multidrug efflux RND transporter periplasmic adaptor subunit [Usitatibacter sp.]
MTDLPPEDPRRGAPIPVSRRRAFVPLLVTGLVILAVLVAWYFWPKKSAAEGEAKRGGFAQQFAKGGGGRKGGGGFDQNRPQPVAVATAQTGDMPVVQTSLGTVLSGRTATVRPRVDGLLQSVLFGEGDNVKAGAILAQIDPAPFQVQLEQADGQLARDTAQLNNARLDLGRYQTLLKQDSIAEQQVDQQAALVRQLEGTVKVDQATVDSAKLQLSYTRISAPIAGRLGLRQVDPGNMVHTSDTNGIVVIAEMNPIGVLFTVTEDVAPGVISQLRAGRKLPVEAWDRDRKNLIARGTLVSADNQVDVSTGTVKLKAEFANNDGKLFPNQFVNVRMVVDVRRNVVIVPSAAVQRNAQGQLVVYAVRSDNTIAVKPVTTGPSDALNTSIVSGLAAGERVVTDGLDRIREGSKVEVTSPAAANAPPPAPGIGEEKGTKGARKGRGSRKSQGKGSAQGPGTT